MYMYVFMYVCAFIPHWNLPVVGSCWSWFLCLAAIILRGILFLFFVVLFLRQDLTVSFSRRLSAPCLLG